MNKHGCYFGEEKEILDFSYNINSCGIENGLKEYLFSRFDQLLKYPEIDGETAKKSLCTLLELKEENCLLGNGAVELLYLYARVMEFQKVLIFAPTFTEYKRAFQLSKTQVVYELLSEEEQFTLSIQQVEQALLRNPGVQGVILCNPNNPTGSYLPRESIEKIKELLEEKKIHFILDESFIDFEEDITYSRWQGEYYFVLRSLTKFYAVPGLRIGYGIMPERIARKLHQHKEPWAMNTFALEAIPYLLSKKAFYQEENRRMRENRSYFIREMNQFSQLTCFPSHSNFILCKVGKDYGKLKTFLLEKGIYVRTCEDFYGLSENYFRFAVKKIEEINRVLAVMSEFFKQ